MRDRTLLAASFYLDCLILRKGALFLRNVYKSNLQITTWLSTELSVQEYRRENLKWHQTVNVLLLMSVAAPVLLPQNCRRCLSRHFLPQLHDVLRCNIQFVSHSRRTLCWLHKLISRCFVRSFVPYLTRRWQNLTQHLMIGSLLGAFVTRLLASSCLSVCLCVRM
jgi:hypothetical protein